MTIFLAAAARGLGAAFGLLAAAAVAAAGEEEVDEGSPSPPSSASTLATRRFGATYSGTATSTALAISVETAP